MPTPPPAPLSKFPNIRNFIVGKTLAQYPGANIDAVFNEFAERAGSFLAKFFWDTHAAALLLYRDTSSFINKYLVPAFMPGAEEAQTKPRVFLGWDRDAHYINWMCEYLGIDRYIQATWFLAEGTHSAVWVKTTSKLEAAVERWGTFEPKHNREVWEAEIAGESWARLTRR